MINNQEYEKITKMRYFTNFSSTKKKKIDEETPKYHVYLKPYRKKKFNGKNYWNLEWVVKLRL